MNIYVIIQVIKYKVCREIQVLFKPSSFLTDTTVILKDMMLHEKFK